MREKALTREIHTARGVIEAHHLDIDRGANWSEVGCAFQADVVEF